MQIYQPSIIARNDTLLGVCAAIGEDFGFNPVWLRVVFAITVFFNLFLAIGLYLALGMVVLLTRRIYPGRRQLLETVAVAAPMEAAPAPAPAAHVESDLILTAA